MNYILFSLSLLNNLPHFLLLNLKAEVGNATIVQVLGLKYAWPPSVNYAI